ncbi:hypothetical protein VCHA38O209_20391 [Vibrio chagasii]|nr:hypothetical protein VCHA35O135_20289 [Vibrio chagasii]CAH7027930.1 hypothetical protein VCHA40P242_10473 [Vibrio chagasii]CAH7430672.1 hypothetical protein VCHA37P202_90016 [Vibrio chagasii]CAH7434283.1 hypothetical protein VCHA38O209_20391 [Vibrio chagasii]
MRYYDDKSEMTKRHKMVNYMNLLFVLIYWIGVFLILAKLR